MKKFFKKLNSYEMSKRILYVLALLIGIVLPFAVITSIITGDASPVSQYVIGVFALASVAVGFYYWKAKNENLHKYADKDSEYYYRVIKPQIEALEADAIGGVDNET